MKIEGYEVRTTWNDKDLKLGHTVKKPGPTRRGKKKKEWFNDIISFDIETSSFFEYVNGLITNVKKYTQFTNSKGEVYEQLNDCRKLAYAYNYCVNLNDTIYNMRNVKQFIKLLSDLSRVNKLDDSKIAVIWVHNLAYEFQFIKDYFEFTEVFTRSGDRDVIRARTTSGIEFRCSMALSGRSLAMLGKKIGFNKKVGDLDYSQLRHSNTVLTLEEMGYIVLDVVIINEYIKTLWADSYDNASIVMTATGFVRSDMRAVVLADAKYKDEMERHTIHTELYDVICQAYQGGYTHANPNYMGNVVSNVIGYDLASSYPASITQFKYPTGRHKYCLSMDAATFLTKIIDNDEVGAFFTITIKNVQSTCDFNYLSDSKCQTKGRKDVDNGRIYYANEITTTITSVDFTIIRDTYTFEIDSVDHLYIYKMEYKPTVYIKQMLNYYNAKTTLKGVEGSEKEYVKGKESLNSIYGMESTDPLNDETYWDDETKSIIVDDTQEKWMKLSMAMTNRKKFTKFEHSAFITAYSRRVLFDGILACQRNNITVYYTDTDSLYIEDNEKSAKLFAELNEGITQRFKEAEQWHGFEDGYTAPKSSNGNNYQLGVWDLDGRYDEFKSLGAKRYLGSKKGEMYLTCAGVNKTGGSEYFEKMGFDGFEHDAIIPAEYSRRNVSSYSDQEPYMCEMVDYNGVTDTVGGISYVHIMETDYHLTIGDEYQKFVDNLAGLYGKIGVGGK